MSSQHRNITVIGAGIAGLAAARELASQGHAVTVLESSDRIGGRVASDRIATSAGACTVDRGFQVYLSAYPEPKRYLDIRALDLRAFMPGALVWNGHRAATVAHPMREPVAALAGVLGGAIPFGDALRMIPFAQAALQGPSDGPGAPSGRTAIERIASAGVSNATIDRFFRSFFGGVFFDRSLNTDSSRLDFLLRMFAEGFACVPARGMGAIAVEMARPIASCIRLASRVAHIDGTRAILEGGGSVEADAVIVATGAHDLQRLAPDLPAIAWQGTLSAWFLTPDPSALPSWLVLNGSGGGAFNHGAAMGSYAPAGRGLFVANTAFCPRGPDGCTDLAHDMRRTLGQILRQSIGRHATEGWELVAVQRIPHAIPRQWPSDLASRLPTTLAPRVFVAGDHLEDASINGAMRSGRLAAERCAAAL